MYETIQEIEDSWSVDEDVDDAFYDVTGLLSRFREENDALCGEDGYDEDEWKKSEKFIQEIEAKKNELKQKQSAAADYDELDTEEAPEVSLPAGRSIFDDIDE